MLQRLSNDYRISFEPQIPNELILIQFNKIVFKKLLFWLLLFFCTFYWTVVLSLKQDRI